jgi:hypothetical protein
MFTALRFTATGAQTAAGRIRILPMNQYACSNYNSQSIGSVENVVPLHADIPRTGGRGSDLLFEAVMQEYLQFPYEYFILVLLPFGGYCCKLRPSNNPKRKKNHKD